MIQSILLVMQDIWFIVTVVFFLLLIIALIFNFFSFFLDFLHAQGCFAVILMAFAFLPTVFILCLAAGYTISSVVLVILSAVGAITGYVVRDSEGNVGKFGYFMMVISILTLLITLFATRLTNLF
ncbi:MAG: hypothetical protein NTU44_20105 [Bacteroidetes bacterium]|nr:hypothetical protein [Bacteroidota bacterium]